MRKTTNLLMVVFLIGCVVFTMTGCGKKKPTPPADPPAGPEPYTWSQNFDGVAVGTSLAGLGFDLSIDDNCKVEVTDAKFVSQPHAAYFEDNSTSKAASARMLLPAELTDKLTENNKGTVKFSIWVDSANGKSSYVTLFSGGYSSTDRFIDVSFTKEGNVQVREKGDKANTSSYTIGQYTRGEWVDVEFTWDYATQKFSLKVGEDTYDDLDCVQRLIPDRLEIKVGDNSGVGNTAYFDNLYYEIYP